MKRLITTVIVALSAFVTPLVAIPAQVIIIRHGEKDAAGNLSQKGLERAGALAPYFAYTQSLITYGPPFSIFAARPTPNTPPYSADENTQRCLQTVSPTAQFLSLVIHSGYARFEEPQLADFVLNNPNYNGKNVLVCWHHEAIRNLAIAFGISSPPTYPDDEFDLTWVITYASSPTLNIFHQRLLLGDLNITP